MIETKREEMNVMIDESFCFKSSRFTIKETQEALAYYCKHRKDASEWLLHSEIPIFLDTNVLLNLYRISLSERESFKNFLGKKKNRVFVTRQVEEEYLRHRLKQIKNFTKQINNLVGDYAKTQHEISCFKEKALDIIAGFKNNHNLSGEVGTRIFDNAEHLLKSEDVTEYLQKLNTALDDGKNVLKEYVEECRDKTNYEYKDPFLEAISSLEVQLEISEKEKTFLKLLYDKLLEEYNLYKDNADAMIEYAFPGCGDRSKSKEGKEPYGDFYIFHELLRYVKNKDTDIVFLTNDVKKSDWVKPGTSEMYVHYIVNIYSLTHHMIYILSANDLIPMSFDPIISDDEEEEKDAKDVEMSEQEDNITDILDDFEERQEIEQRVEEVHSYFRHISEDEFIKELRIALNWAQEYGGGYVSEIYFIHGILGSKRYEFHRSREVLQNLIDVGKVLSEKEKHDGREINCLKFKDR